ncbi:MAG TPA: NADH-quinone oxidoreductase subunit C, partial [Patescibacteria group bacterium]|nr:NADH-quinone oxidoreductase subunit C [Patescibacteria group bacterium]
MTFDHIIRQYFPKGQKGVMHGNNFLFEVPATQLLTVMSDLYNQKQLPLKTVTAMDERKKDNSFKVFYVFGVPKENVFLIPYIRLEEGVEEFPSLVGVIHEVSWYERAIHTFFGLTPKGHPHLEPLILHHWPKEVYPLRKDFAWDTRVEPVEDHYKFIEAEGEGIYEIPVGPVHAGIIEPGYFRFTVTGEHVLFFEPRLGYVHKGTEKLFEVLPLEKKVKLSERVSGDTSFAHSLAFCQAVESLADVTIPERAQYLRVIYSELERIANHCGDIGMVMTDTAYTFGGSNGARLREVVMQWNERLTGSRFLRGVNIFGGVTKDMSLKSQNELREMLDAL